MKLSREANDSPGLELSEVTALACEVVAEATSSSTSRVKHILHVMNNY